jgi:hypothetical protein
VAVGRNLVGRNLEKVIKNEGDSQLILSTSQPFHWLFRSYLHFVIKKLPRAFTDCTQTTETN